MPGHLENPHSQEQLSCRSEFLHLPTFYNCHPVVVLKLAFPNDIHEIKEHNLEQFIQKRSRLWSLFSLLFICIANIYISIKKTSVWLCVCVFVHWI